MKALFVTPTSYPELGGLQSYCHNLCQQFAAQGDDVLLFTLQTEADPRAGEWRYGSYRVKRMNRITRSNPLLSAWQKLYVFGHLMAAAHMHHADFIFCIFWDPLGYLCVPAARLLGIPYYSAALGQEIYRVPESGPGHWPKTILRNTAFRRADRVFAISHYTRDRLLDIGIPAGMVSICPPGIDGDIEESDGGRQLAARSRLGIEQHNVILQVSRLVPRKAHDAVIAALPLILCDEPNTLYVAVGGGPEQERLQALARATGVEKHVLFTGRVTDETLADWYRASDVFVMPCRAGRDGRDFEGFGIVFLEAYRYGKPVVAGRSGGVEDVVSDGITGFLVHPDDIQGLAERIRQLLADRPLAERMGRQGQALVQQTFDWQIVSRQLRDEILTLHHGRS